MRLLCNILNVSAISAGSLAIGEYLAGTGIDNGTKIIPGGTGTGGVGTYLINNSYNLSSRAMTGTAWSRFFNFNNAAATYGKKVALYECNIEVGAPTIVGASSLPGFNNVPNFTVDANNTLFPNGAQTYSQNTLIPTSVGAILVVYAASSSGPNVYVKLGTSSSVTATTSDILVSSNGWTAIAVGANTWVAVIAATGSSSVVLAGGNTNFVGGETGTKNGFFAAPSYFLQPYCGVTSTNNPIPKGAKLVVCNPGAVAAYIKLGTTNAVTATTSGGGYDYTVAANGGWTVFDVGSNEYVASICASGSTTLILMGGTGTVAAGTTGTNPYGGPSGLIAQFYRAFFASAQFQQLTEWHSSWFYSYSQSYMASIYAMATPDPWLTFPQINPAAYDAGDTILTPYKNWDAHVRYNTGLVC